MIRFACPNPQCRAQYTVPDHKAGKKTTCTNPACGMKIRVPMPPPPPPPVEGDLLDEETGAVVRDWREVDAQLQEPEPLPPDRGDLTELRCYDCGRRIYEEELVRRDVSVGGSLWSSFGSSSRGNTWDTSGSSTHYGRVDLCLNYSEARDRVAFLQMVAMAVGAVVILLGVACAGIVSMLR